MEMKTPRDETVCYDCGQPLSKDAWDCGRSICHKCFCERRRLKKNTDLWRRGFRTEEERKAKAQID
jgi:Zn finger protein HypA/HybF involved in hydrogenase expression